MKKLTGFENYMLTTGLEMYKEHMLKQIQVAEAEGRTPLFTSEAIKGHINHLNDKLDKLTLKSRS